MKIFSIFTKVLILGAIALLPLSSFASHYPVGTVELSTPVAKFTVVENGNRVTKQTFTITFVAPDGTVVGTDVSTRILKSVPAPIDGGISVLIGSGLLFGLKRARNKRRLALQK